jgi:hypothetical protein
MDAENALSDVAKSIKMLNGRLVDNEVKAYKQLVMGVATYIAGAFDEDEDDEEKGLWGALSNLVVGVANPALKADLNTSPDEDSALTELTEVLKG